MYVAHHISHFPTGVRASYCRDIDFMLGASRAPIGGWWIHHGRFLCFVAEVLRLTDCVSEFLMYVAHHISHLPAGVGASYCRDVEPILKASWAPICGWWIYHGRFLCFVAEVPRLTECVSDF